MSNQKILIYAPELTRRLRYTFEFIFEDILGCEVSFTYNDEEVKSAKIPAINYSHCDTGHGLFFPAGKLLFEDGINQKANDVIRNTCHWRGFKLPFKLNSEGPFPFDPFALSFYLISRYEEYLPFTHDKYNRFPSSESILTGLGLLDYPIVDMIAYAISDKLKEKFRGFSPAERKFKYIPTYDLDNPWAFLHKGLFRNISRTAYSALTMNFNDIFHRMRVLSKKIPDPYFTYDFISELHDEYDAHPIFFILVGDYSKFDKTINWQHAEFQKLVKTLAERYDIGLHPSFASNFDKKMLEVEKTRLEKIIGRKITKSRQHYLKLTVPDTFRHLEKIGITDDYTLGFADEPGFRAGTCTPFKFFNLKENKITDFRITPLMVMDASLIDYLKLSPDEALRTIKLITENVKKVNGTMVSLWHNHTFSPLNSGDQWRAVYAEEMEISS